MLPSISHLFWLQLSSVVRTLETHERSSSTSTLRLSKLPLNIRTKEFFSAHTHFLVKSQKLLSLELTALLPLIYPLAFLPPVQYILSTDLNVSVVYENKHFHTGPVLLTFNDLIFFLELNFWISIESFT